MRLKPKMNFQEARAFVHSLGLRSKREWYTYCKGGTKPKSILSTPHRTYKKIGWISWGDWLGTGRIAEQYKEFKSFEEARQVAQSLSLKGVNEWHMYAKSSARPKDIPSNPSLFYKGKGWIDWADFLGATIQSRNSKNFMKFYEARNVALSAGLRSYKEWISWCKSGKKPRNIPTNPNLTYKDHGWIDWYDWLGNPSPVRKGRR